MHALLSLQITPCSFISRRAFSCALTPHSYIPSHFSSAPVASCTSPGATSLDRRSGQNSVQTASSALARLQASDSLRWDRTPDRTNSRVEVGRVELERKGRSVSAAIISDPRLVVITSARSCHHLPGALRVGHRMEDVPHLRAIRREEVAVMTSPVLAVVAREDGLVLFLVPRCRIDGVAAGVV